jgi:FlaA1/EpsC-like NDP-sugar epimerase
MIKNILRPTFLKRSLFFIISDIFAVIISLYVAFLLRFDFSLPERYYLVFLSALAPFILVKLAVSAVFRLYNLTWRYVGLDEIIDVLKAAAISELLLLALLTFLDRQLPRSIYVMDLIISFSLMSFLRISKRVFLEFSFKIGYEKRGKTTIIIGAGNTGEMILREIKRQREPLYKPVGFLDDDKIKIGNYIHGVKVINNTRVLKDVILRYRVEVVIIAIPFLARTDLRRIYETARDCGVEDVKIIPELYDIYTPHISIKALEEIRIEDLLKRELVAIDYDEIRKFLRDETVLITGAGGSIGSEIALQVAVFHPRKLILLDIDETELFNLERRLKERYPDSAGNMLPAVADIRDEDRINRLYESFRPNLVFHAAAYKHVPLMEHNCEEAVKTNIAGTYILAKAASRYGVRKFIFISTDKAVRPVSVMGATKKAGEYICGSFNGLAKTEFVSVRFGNVLGSRGSVFSVFLEQLKKGGPLTVTNKDVKRYFMTTPEAVSLVLQASAIGQGGQILVLDMGQPVRILELAEDLIRLHGLEPYKDIDISFIGLRDGEKVFEEMLTSEEKLTATRYKMLLSINDPKIDLGQQYLERIKSLNDTAKGAVPSGKEGCVNLLKGLVPGYNAGS